MDTARKDSQLVVETKTASDVLSSWKEIAQYLGRGVRTVQRWERQNNLPICRPSRGAGLVLAHKKDLDQWIATGRADTNDETNVDTTIAELKSQLEAARAEIAKLREQLQPSPIELVPSDTAQKRATSERPSTGSSQDNVIRRSLIA